MKEKKSQKGMGKYQEKTRTENRDNILKVLIDNQWHNYKEIKDKTNLSNPALSGHLKKLKPLLDYQKDPDSKRLSAQYKIKPIFALELKRAFTMEIACREIEEKFQKTHNLKSTIEAIDAITNQFLIALIISLKGNKELRKDSKVVNLLLETFVWENYKTLTLKLVEMIRNQMKD